MVRVLEEGQTIVRSGEIVTALDIEAMEALGLSERPRTDFWATAWRGLILLVAFAALGLYVWSIRRRARAIFDRV